MKSIVLGANLLVAIFLVACTDQAKTTNTLPENLDVSIAQNTNDMNSFTSLFEIPATDVSRAVTFYQAILGIEIEQMEMPGMEMGIFPYEGQLVPGVIMKAEGMTPSANGVTIYLNGGDDLQPILDKVEVNGGKILVPKTAHADESGYFAMFLDTEGNKLGLNSPN